MFFNMFKNKLEKSFYTLAKSEVKTIALPEAEFGGIIIKAAQRVTKKGFAKIALIGDEVKIKNTFLRANFEGIEFIDPKNYDKTLELAKKLYALRKNKGLTLEESKKLILDPIYFSVMLLKEGIVDGVVGGAATTSANMLKPALQLIDTNEQVKTVSSSFIMIGKRRMGDKGVLVMGDCAVNVSPTKEQLADIAIATAETAKTLARLTPRVAMLSYSTHGSGKGESVDRVVEATKIIKQKAPELIVEGELQADSALNSKVARVKSKNNDWKGNANVLIMPDLNTGNISYKLMKIAGKIKAIGPIMQGFEQPVNDLSRGANLKEVVLTICITAVQASKLDEAERKERLKQEKIERHEEKKRLKIEKKEQKAKLKEERQLEKEQAQEVKAETTEVIKDTKEEVKTTTKKAKKAKNAKETETEVKEEVKTEVEEIKEEIKQD